MRLTEFFILLEQKDRLAYLAKTYFNKLVKRFKEDHKNNRLRGRSAVSPYEKITDGQLTDAVKEIIDHFADGDPSKNKKYTDWIVRQWLLGNLLWEDVPQMDNLLLNFEKHRKNLDIKDINGYKDYRDLRTALQPYIGKEAAGIKVKNFLNNPETQNRIYDQKVANPSDRRVVEIHAEIAELREQEDPPDWFKQSMEDGMEDLIKDGVDEEDFRDPDTEEIDLADYEAYVERELKAYVDANVRDEWEEHVEQQIRELERELDYQDKVPALFPYYLSDRLSVFVPNSVDAACYVGKGTEWCTAYTEADNAFMEYRPHGELYTILTDKMGKYQFHFESAQFMDEHDVPIDSTDKMSKLISTYPELQEAFAQKGKETYEMWLVPVNEISNDMWMTLLKASQGDKEAVEQISSTRGGMRWDIRETMELLARNWVVHKDNIPDQIAAQLKKVLIKNAGIRAFENGWIDKEEATEDNLRIMINKAVANNNVSELFGILSFAKENNVEFSKDIWHYMVANVFKTIFMVPTEYLNEELWRIALDEWKNESSHSSPPPLILVLGHVNAILAGNITLFPVSFKHLAEYRDQFEANAKTILKLITKEDIQNTINRPQVLDWMEAFKDHFGDFPWVYAIEKYADGSIHQEGRLELISMGIYKILKENGPNLNISNDQIINMLITRNPNLIFRLQEVIYDYDVALAGFKEKALAHLQTISNYRTAEHYYEVIRPFLSIEEIAKVREYMSLRRAREIETLDKDAFGNPIQTKLDMELAPKPDKPFSLH